MLRKKNKDVLFLCGAKDFHAMDKFTLLARELGVDKILLVTDTLEGERQKNLLKPNYDMEKLFIIDKFTLSIPSKTTDFVRNMVKFIFIPFQAIRLRKIWMKYQPRIVHAAPIYYMLLCYFAKIPYVGTPQAGEILDRPKESLIYKFFAKLALRKASNIIVDSLAMKKSIKKQFGFQANLIKNGFNINEALSAQNNTVSKKSLFSIRGIQDNYQIEKIITSLNKLHKRPKINFAYPAYHIQYLEFIKSKISAQDQLLGMLSKKELYLMMASSLLVISIPVEDSSPRSVYEAIFCGAIVAVTQMPYLNELPSCMKERIYIVDMDNKNWLPEAILFAESKSLSKFVPSDEAIRMCDESYLIKKVVREIYGFSVV